MATLCSPTSLVGLVPKGKWLLSWTNDRCRRNLGSLIRTKLQTPMKWMQASRFSSSKESSSYTMCYEGDDHCGVWNWWGNTASRCTSKADSKRCLLPHVPAAPLYSAQKTTTLGGKEPHYSSWKCKDSHHYCCDGPLVSLAMEDSEISTIITRYESMLLQSHRQSARSTARYPLHHKRWTYPCYRRSIRNINKDGRVDGVRCIPNIWQNVINKGRLYWRYINAVPLWIKPYIYIYNCYHYLLSILCIFQMNY